MTNTVISYPIPAYQNLPIQPEFYKPRRFVISSLSLGKTTTVTTVLNQDYVVGQQVRFIIPTDCGTRQLNERSGFIIQILSDTQVVVDIDSQAMTSFTSPIGRDEPQILAIGDINSGAVNTQGRVNQVTFIPGSFINIS